MGAGGSYIHNLDEKNRFKVPAKLRDRIGTELYLIKSPDPEVRCIYAYSEEEWEKLCLSLESKVENTLEGRRATRKLMSRVVFGEVDKGGRFTLNTALKEFAGIQGEICIVNSIRHLEFWAPEVWLGEEEVLDETSISDLDIPF